MGKYTRMNPAQFAEWIKNNLHHGEFVAFALDENGSKVSSDESLAKGDVDLKCWYCATIVKSEDYDFNVLLINYAGGGQPYAIEIEDDLPEMLDIYFNTVNDFYDNDHEIVIETRYKARARISSKTKNTVTLCFAYAHTIEAAKKKAMLMLNALCQMRSFPIGECSVDLAVTQDEEYIESDECIAEWNGKEIVFDVEKM